MRATITNWNEARGYGFAKPQEGEAIFVHASKLPGIVGRIGLEIECDVVPNERKAAQARNVTVLNALPSDAKTPFVPAGRTPVMALIPDYETEDDRYPRKRSKRDRRYRS
jgi:cold shock CspA family protein